MFASLDHTRMSIWDALSQFSGMREYEAALFDPGSSLLDPDMPLMQHALQVNHALTIIIILYASYINYYYYYYYMPVMQHALQVNLRTYLRVAGC